MYCGQTEKAVSVCERVINELPEPATAYAYFIKGVCMLHRFDSGGIELVYRAIAINTNYIYLSTISTKVSAEIGSPEASQASVSAFRPR